MNYYFFYEYIKWDINKAIHYFTLAANQNNPEAQFNLGFIYYEGKYIKRDINKSIHYYTLIKKKKKKKKKNMKMARGF